MNKNPLNDEYEDDEEDIFSGDSFSDLFSLFSDEDSDMSEEEKADLIAKNKEAVQRAVKSFIDSRPDVRRLLAVNADLAAASESELNYADKLSYEEMLDAGYIVFDINANTLDKNKEIVRCILSVGVSEDSIDFTVFCYYDNWQLDNYKFRPVELQSIIYDYFMGKEGILPTKLHYSSCSNQAIRDDVGAVMSIYNERNSLFSTADEDEAEKAFPLEHYSDIVRTVVDRLVNNTDIKQYLPLDKTENTTDETLISEGYIRLTQKITVDDNTPDQYLIITLEDSIGLRLSFDIISKKATAIMKDGRDRVKLLLKCIKDAMSMIPGVETKGSHSQNDLSDEWSLSSIMFGVEYTEELANCIISEEERKRVKPRFFVDISTINQILDLELTNEEFETDSIQESRVDIIDIPYYMYLAQMDDGKGLTIHDRSEFCVSCDMDGTVKGNLTLSKKTGTKGTASEETIGGNLGAFFKASMIISKHFIESGLKDSIDYMDFDREGFLISVSDNVIRFETVSGRKRPDMMCSGGVFNSTRMMRPYIDEMSGPTMKELGGEKALLQMAEHNDESAMLSLAELYANGDGNTAVNPDQSFYWYEKLALLDHPTAQYNLAQFYFRGFGTKRDFEKAIYWMRKAVENGDEDAPEQLAAYEKTAADAKDALAGDSQAQADYAKFLMQAGNSTEQPEKDLNYAECVKWAQKAADQGNADGMWIMGLAYEHGRGVAQNSSKAVEYYQQGAELGNDQAMNSYAAYISRGNVPGKTAKDAFELIKKAAEKGNVLAMRNLGHCYQFEEGTHHDMQQAIFWYEKYLEHEEDEELARKVMIFKMMPDITDDSFESDDEYEKVDPGTFTKDLVRIEFKDKIFVLTGFDTREENKITSIISERGGIIKSSTVLKTDYLVVRGDYSSRKYERAVELNQKGKNIAIISSEQFYDLLD